MRVSSRDAIAMVMGLTFALCMTACQKPGDSGATSGSAAPSEASGLLGSPASGLQSSPASGVLSNASEGK
ncbi:hypothetical protein [Pararobbsia alpina]|uniref:Lipoprotein n=1 Tax=Pararobbsia alpina TaxID=621374 RepID=A0A6S7AYQ4_9BURK|nr:hypothetical protein [Pararobbsia alpina]CAB3781984.1 hypothetical protein LMG28138_01411 [Pararobbsia alpina]